MYGLSAPVGGVGKQDGDNLRGKNKSQKIALTSDTGGTLVFTEKRVTTELRREGGKASVWIHCG